MENQVIIQEIVKIIENYKNENNLNYNDLKFMVNIDKIRILINNIIIKKNQSVSISELHYIYIERH